MEADREAITSRVAGNVEIAEVVKTEVLSGLISIRL